MSDAKGTAPNTNDNGSHKTEMLIRAIDQRQSPTKSRTDCSAEAIEMEYVLAKAGVVVFAMPPNVTYDPHAPKQLSGGTPNPAFREFHHPRGWDKFTPETIPVGNQLQDWKQGWATAIVAGDLVSIIDVDTKNGANVQRERERLDAHDVPIIATVITASGGAHFYTRATGMRCTNNTEKGIDFRGRGIDGGGAGYVYGPATSRPKYAGLGYQVTQQLDPADLQPLPDRENEENRESLNAYFQSHGITLKTHQETGIQTAGIKPDMRTVPKWLKDELSYLGRQESVTNKRGGSDTRHIFDVTTKEGFRNLDRSARFHGLIAKCMKAELNQASTTWLMNEWVKDIGYEKYKNRVDTEVARSWASLTPNTNEPENVTTNPAAPISINEFHGIFRKWLGHEYDTTVCDAVAAATTVTHLDGDPLWLLVLSGSGNAKTEVVQAAAGTGATVTSTLSGEAALLSGTSAKDKAEDATGGLLRKIGDKGTLVIKDMTSILSMGGEARAGVLAALREIYDGRWERNIGSDGGRTLTWHGRIIVIGAVTTAWDTHHSVVAAMGDRFAVIRSDSGSGRMASGRQAIGNVGSETQMRAELSDAMLRLTAGANLSQAKLDENATEKLLYAANLVTLARTAVETDYAGNVIDAHAPEMPTRFAKMLAQFMRGTMANGTERDRALAMSMRVAADSMPPLRLAILADIARNAGIGGTTSHAVSARLQKPYKTVDRQVQALHLLGLLLWTVEEEVTKHGYERNRWLYRLAERPDEGITAETVIAMHAFAGIPVHDSCQILRYPEGIVENNLLNKYTGTAESATNVSGSSERGDLQLFDPLINATSPPTSATGTASGVTR